LTKWQFIVNYINNRAQTAGIDFVQYHVWAFLFLGPFPIHGYGIPDNTGFPDIKNFI